MRWTAIWDAAAGLYLGIEDPRLDEQHQPDTLWHGEWQSATKKVAQAWTAEGQGFIGRSGRDSGTRTSSTQLTGHTP
jgi:hypothetical protein